MPQRYFDRVILLRDVSSPYQLTQIPYQGIFVRHLNK